MIRIAAIVVTHNRLSLLKEAIAAIKAQSFPVTELIVVNNGSNDGTEDWLKRQTGITAINQGNEGASAGFCTGMRIAYQHGADWLWLMDDDTICWVNTLQKLVEKIPGVHQPIGFLSSKSVWVDHSPHLMNLPAIKPSFNQNVPFNQFDEHGLLVIETSSFVSLLINRAAITEVGLPYREFFIWGDDQEFTRRITKAGYLGLYCIDSVVLHKTVVNYCPDFYRDKASNLFKYNYGFRNEFFMVKKTRGFVYFIFWLSAKVIYTSFQLLRIRNSDRIKFLKVLCSSAWKSIFFAPKIQKV